MTTSETLAGMLTICAGIPAAAPVLESLPRPMRESRPTPLRTLPVCRWLDPGVAPRPAQAVAPLVQALIEGHAGLDWRQTYSAADFGPAFLERYGWSELAGERGPIASASVPKSSIPPTPMRRPNSTCRSPAPRSGRRAMRPSRPLRRASRSCTTLGCPTPCAPGRRR